MKKLKKLFILLLAMTTFLAVGCTSQNEANTNNDDVSQIEVNASNNDVSQNEDTADVIKDLNLDYSSNLDENGFFSNVKAVDYVELVDYDKISIPMEEHVITEEIVQENLDNILSNFTTTVEITDRLVVSGDTLNIDYVGSVDGVEFEGGSTAGAGTEVTIGVTSYIDDFLDQLIGHNPGESFDIQVTFPVDYGVDNLNGKDANFAITINYINEVITPELTDDFVSGNITDTYNVNTVEELKALIQNDLRDNAVKGYIENYLLMNMIVLSIPDEVAMYQELSIINYYTMSAKSSGITLEEFLQNYVGYDSVEALIEASSEELNIASEGSLIIQAIAEDANISVTEEVLTDYFLKYTGSEDYSEFEELYSLPYLKNSILHETVLDYLATKAELEN